MLETCPCLHDELQIDVDGGADSAVGTAQQSPHLDDALQTCWHQHADGPVHLLSPLIHFRHVVDADHRGAVRLHWPKHHEHIRGQQLDLNGPFKNKQKI